MKSRIPTAVLTALLLLGATACGGGDGSTAVEESPSAVPGMDQENVQPTTGTAATELPSE